MSELVPTVFAMAKKERLVDLWLAQPGHARCKYHAGHYYSVIFDGSARQDEAIAITVRFVNEQWEIIQRLVRIDIVAKFVAGTQLSQVLMESLFTDLQLRGKQVLAMITDGAAINRAAVRNLDPRKRLCRG